MKIIIAGGRNFNNYKLLENKVDYLLKELSGVSIISGKARGADYLGEVYAKKHSLPIIEYPANWNKYGKSAGYIRNEEMAKIADRLIAFWDGKSKGTNHMINLAKKYKLKIAIINY